MLSEGVQLALIASIPVTLTAMATAAGVLANVVSKVKKNTEAIKVSTDGNLTLVKTELALARKEIQGLQGLIAELHLAKVEVREALKTEVKKEHV